MTVSTTIPQVPTDELVETIVNPEDPNELWVIPASVLGPTTLPRLRHLLPADFQSAVVVGFVPMPIEDSYGAWVLRRVV